MTSGGSISETDLSPLYKEVQGKSEPTAAEVLKARSPNPDAGYDPFSKFHVGRLTRCTIKHMRRLCEERDIELDFEYWEKHTRRILSQPTPEDAIVVSAPAGAGKSTWIEAFHLALTAASSFLSTCCPAATPGQYSFRSWPYQVTEQS